MKRSKTAAKQHLRTPTEDHPIDPTVDQPPHPDVHPTGITSRYLKKKDEKKKAGFTGNPKWVSGKEELAVEKTPLDQACRIFAIIRKRSDGFTLVVYQKLSAQVESVSPELKLPMVDQNQAENFSQVVGGINRQLNITMFKPLVLESKGKITGCYSFGYVGRVEISRPIGMGPELRRPVELRLEAGISSRLDKNDCMVLKWALVELVKDRENHSVLLPLKAEFKLKIPAPRKKKSSGVPVVQALAA